MPELALSGSTLPSTPAESLALINASPYVKKPLAESDVWMHTIEAASSRFIPDRFAFLSSKTLRNIVDDAKAGIAFMTRHAHGGMFGGADENPYGRTFAAALQQQQDGVSRVLMQVYMLCGHTPNGAASASTDDLNKGIVGGTLFDASLGLTLAGGAHLLLCDVCTEGVDLVEIASETCPHWPGSTENMSADQIAKQTGRGVPGGKCSITFEDWHGGELSVVYNGAIPGAGTAFAANKQGATMSSTTACNCCNQAGDCGCNTSGGGTCSCHSDCAVCVKQKCPGKATTATQHSTQHSPLTEDNMKYSAELKVTLGLAATATDEDVDAKLTSLKAASDKVATLEAEGKKTADNLFRATFKDKLDEATIEMLVGEPKRDKLAAHFVEKAAPAFKPQIGDPLKGASGGAAKPGDPGSVTSEMSEEWREGFAVHKTDADLQKAVLTSPLGALAKCLGVTSLHPSRMHREDEAGIIDNRKAAYGIA